MLPTVTIGWTSGNATLQTRVRQHKVEEEEGEEEVHIICQYLNTIHFFLLTNQRAEAAGLNITIFTGQQNLVKTEAGKG